MKWDVKEGLKVTDYTCSSWGSVLKNKKKKYKQAYQILCITKKGRPGNFYITSALLGQYDSSPVVLDVLHWNKNLSSTWGLKITQITF